MHIWTHVFLERGYQILQENISRENQDDISKKSCTVFQRLIAWCTQNNLGVQYCIHLSVTPTHAATDIDEASLKCIKWLEYTHLFYSGECGSIIDCSYIVTYRQPMDVSCPLTNEVFCPKTTVTGMLTLLPQLIFKSILCMWELPYGTSYEQRNLVLLF